MRGEVCLSHQDPASYPTLFVTFALTGLPALQSQENGFCRLLSALENEPYSESWFHYSPNAESSPRLNQELPSPHSHLVGSSGRGVTSSDQIATYTREPGFVLWSERTSQEQRKRRSCLKKANEGKSGEEIRGGGALLVD
jgi:hypothetical protein